MFFEKYFSEKEIIKFLISKRISEARKRREIHFIRNISTFHDKMPDSKLSSLFPPRRSWLRLNQKERLGKSSNKIYEESLYKTIIFHINKTKNNTDSTPDWLNNLLNKISDIKTKACDYSTEKILKSPAIFPALKDAKKNTYRPIALYSIEDKLIISGVAKYLTDILDTDLHPCAVAFRSSNNKSSYSNNHHGTVMRIIDYQKQYGYQELWAAECDIKKFFDCVNHKFALDALIKAVDRAKARSIDVDKRAIDWYIAYLNSYSFNIYAKGEEYSLSKKTKKKIHFEWLSNREISELYHSTELENTAIGIPQGGAISCLIANLIMHEVDSNVLSQNNNESLLYLRYCDDMIIINPSVIECQSALERYYSALKKHKLVAHPPANIPEYNKKFWDEKSKAPYRWANPSLVVSSVPWLSFVGYQLRYDGYIRVRPKSVNSELKKQVEIVDSVIRSIKGGTNKSKDYSHVKLSQRQITYRVTNKLISMSVGRVKLSRYNEPEMCWASGFELIRTNPSFMNMIKKLDKNREKQLIRLNKNLILIQNKTLPNNIKKDKVKFFGKPFSYYNAIRK